MYRPIYLQEKKFRASTQNKTFCPGTLTKGHNNLVTLLKHENSCDAVTKVLHFLQLPFLSTEIVCSNKIIKTSQNLIVQNCIL